MDFVETPKRAAIAETVSPVRTWYAPPGETGAEAVAPFVGALVSLSTWPGKITDFPIVLVGSAYWQGLLDWMRETSLAAGTISQVDLDRLILTDDVDEAISLVVAAREAHRS